MLLFRSDIKIDINSLLVVTIDTQKRQRIIGNIVLPWICIFRRSKIDVNILFVITMGTNKGRKIIVKVVIGPFKGPKLPFVMCRF